MTAVAATTRRPAIRRRLAPAVAMLVSTLMLGACVHTSRSVTTSEVGLAAPASLAAKPVGLETDATAPADAPGYYLEFRARPSPVIGHTYMIYGPLDATGRAVETNYVGMYPEGGIFGLAGGIAPLPIPADLDGNWGDRNLPVMASYRTRLDADRYRRLVAFVAAERLTRKYWNIWVYNCNSFSADVAEVVGLKAPKLIVVPSQIYVAALRAMNEEGRSAAEVEAGMKKHVIAPAGSKAQAAPAGTPERAVAPSRG